MRMGFRVAGLRVAAADLAVALAIMLAQIAGMRVRAVPLGLVTVVRENQMLSGALKVLTRRLDKLQVHLESVGQKWIAV